MPECKKCHAPLIWGQPYKKGDLPVNPNGSKHMCGGKQRQELEFWGRKWKDDIRYTVPIWCYVCEKTYPRDAVCNHILSDGFIEGVDTCEFYSDRWSAVKNRERLKAARKKASEVNEYDPREEVTQKTYKEAHL